MAKITGDAGDNVLSGTAAADVIIGGGGKHDELYGLASNDALTAGDGNDLLDGGTGADTMNGGKGDDTYIVDNVGDKIVESVAKFPGGYDTVWSSVDFSLAKFGNVEALFLQGAGDLKATGNALGNTIYGTDGDNVIDGGASNDYMAGGKGNDTYYYDHTNDYAKELANEGNDTVVSKLAFTQLVANVENYTFNTAAVVTFTGDAGDNIIKGGSAGDTISGGGGEDQLVGNGGNDKLTGGSGNDVLNGGIGADVMTGAAGNDTYTVDNAGDKVVELGGGGSLDIIISSISIAKLADNVEWAMLTGKANLNLTGNDDVNLLVGNDGNNVLDGGLGVDLLSGGKGNDTYIVDNFSETLFENANEGIDLVKSSASFVLGTDIENLILTGTDDNLATGNGLNNKLTGNVGANQLDGKGGADTMSGGKGDDGYRVDDAGDKLVELAGQGTDTVLSSVTIKALWANVENATLVGSAAIDITGNALANLLVGNDGNNVIKGGLGADVMLGHLGNDTYFIDNAKDVVIENSKEGLDTIFSTIALTQVVANVESYHFTTAATVHFTGDSATALIEGGSGADILDGSAGTASLFGNAGNDILIGGAGSDYLVGGTGADKMLGGSGSDQYVVDNAGDVVTELANGGMDTIFATVSITALAANTEVLWLNGSANINGTGNGLDNTILGNAGANKLDGGIGDDVLYGGLGTDKLTGGAGKDTFMFYLDSNEGHDTIADFVKAQDVLDFHNIGDKNKDTMVDLGDLFFSVASVTDAGVGKNVDVIFDNGAHLTFAGAGTGSVNSIDDLVVNLATQIHVN